MMTGHRQRACAYVQCCACNRTVILFPVDILQVSLTTQLSSAIMAVPAHHDKRSSIEKADIERIEQVSDAPTPTHQLLERRWRHRHHHMEDMVRHLHTFVDIRTLLLASPNNSCHDGKAGDTIRCTYSKCVVCASLHNS
jgi:hypothetical protein